MLFSVLTRKGKASRHNFHPEMSQSWLRGSRSQSAAPSGPSSHILSRSHSWQSQAPNPIGPHSPQAVQIGRLVLTNWDPERRPLLVGHGDRDGGELHHSSRPGPRLVEGLIEGSGALQDIVPNLFPGHSRTQSWMSFKASRRRPDSASYLTLHLMTTTPPLTQSLPHWSLIDSNLWVEQNVLLTNSWAGQLTVTHWQLAACEWGPLRHQARLSNTYSLGTGWVERKHIKGYLRRTVLILLCSTVNRIKITVRLRLVKIVLKVVWPSQSCWLWTISYTICWECGQVTVVGGA